MAQGNTIGIANITSYRMVTSATTYEWRYRMEVKVEISAKIIDEQGEKIFRASSAANNIGQALLESNNRILEDCYVSRRRRRNVD